MNYSTSKESETNTEFAGAATRVTAESAECVSEGPSSSHASPSSGAAAPATGTHAMPPDKQDHSSTDAALAVIEQANGINRLPGNSGAEYIKDKQFSQARLDELIKLYQVGLGQDLLKYQWRCELVYAIHKETAKSGCKGMFSATLRRIPLPDSTAYDMLHWHRVRIGEIKDPDAPDSRDVEESGPDNGESTNDESGKPKPPRQPAPRVVLVIKGTLADAIAEIRSFDQYPDDKTAIVECVLHVWREFSAASANDARAWCSRVVARLSEDEKKKHPLLVAMVNAEPSASPIDVVRIAFRYLVRSRPWEEQESTAEILADAAKDELDSIREELKRKADFPQSTSEAMPSDPAMNDGRPLSEPAPAPTKPRRRLMLNCDDGGLPQPNENNQVLGEVSDGSEAA